MRELTNEELFLVAGAAHAAASGCQPAPFGATVASTLSAD